jgi:acyl-CoA dehydrogenase
VTTYSHLSAEHSELLRNAEALARDELAPLAREGTPGQINRPLVLALGEHGLLSRVLGGEVPALELCLIREGLARYCTEAETAFAVQGLGAHPILANGSRHVVADWVPRVAGGEAIAGFALTEPGAGSDVAALALQADRDGWLPPHRREDLHLQRSGRRHLLGVRANERARPHGVRCPARQRGGER